MNSPLGRKCWADSAHCAVTTGCRRVVQVTPVPIAPFQCWPSVVARTYGSKNASPSGSSSARAICSCASVCQSPSRWSHSQSDSKPTESATPAIICATAKGGWLGTLIPQRM